MPRFVRNFWITLTTDARQRVETGPKSVNGGFDMYINMREKGAVSDKTVALRGRVAGNKLVVEARDSRGEWLTLSETER
jgi:hypothetical protein